MLKFKKIYIGVFISTVIFAAAVAAASLCIVKLGSLPNIGAAAFIVTVLCGAAAITGAWFTARMAGERGLLHGAVIGAVCTALYMTAAVMMKCPVLSAVTAVRVLLLMLCGAAGGIAGVNKGKEKIQF